MAQCKKCTRLTMVNHAECLHHSACINIDNNAYVPNDCGDCIKILHSKNREVIKELKCSLTKRAQNVPGFYWNPVFSALFGPYLTKGDLRPSRQGQRRNTGKLVQEKASTSYIDSPTDNCNNSESLIPVISPNNNVSTLDKRRGSQDISECPSKKLKGDSPEIQADLDPLLNQFGLKGFEDISPVKPRPSPLASPDSVKSRSSQRSSDLLSPNNETLYSQSLQLPTNSLLNIPSNGQVSCETTLLSTLLPSNSGDGPVLSIHSASEVPNNVSNYLSPMRQNKVSNSVSNDVPNKDLDLSNIQTSKEQVNCDIPNKFPNNGQSNKEQVDGILPNNFPSGSSDIPLAPPLNNPAH